VPLFLAALGALTAPGRSQERWVNDFGYSAGGWRVENHPRVLADVDGDRKADIVGFADDGVWVSRSTGTSFTTPSRWLTGTFGYLVGWRVEAHPRFVVDITGDGRADIVGFASDGVYVSVSTGTTFAAASRWLAGHYGYTAGWRVEAHPRFVVDVTGDGRADIVGFASDGVYVSGSWGTTFGPPTRVVTDFGYTAGWRVESHPRFVVDVTGDGLADIVGCGHAGVYVARSLGFAFTTPQLWSSEFGSVSGWLVDAHPREVIDLDRDRRADLVGFASDGVYVARSTGSSFERGVRRTTHFGYSTGWRVGLHPRLLADIAGDGAPDVIGFSDSQVEVLANASGPTPSPWSCEFTVRQGWLGQHPRMMADVTGDGRADIVGFANEGVYVQSPPTTRGYGAACYGFSAGYVSLGSRCDQRRVFLTHHGDDRTFGWFAVGTRATDLPIAGGCRLLTMPQLMLPATPVGLNGSELTLDAVPTHLRAPLFWQYLAVHQGVVVSSNGVETRL
jgi:hypothetical protein